MRASSSDARSLSTMGAEAVEAVEDTAELPSPETLSASVSSKSPEFDADGSLVACS
jgi:hypothetical protein